LSYCSRSEAGLEILEHWRCERDSRAQGDGEAIVRCGERVRRVFSFIRHRSASGRKVKISALGKTRNGLIIDRTMRLLRYGASAAGFVAAVAS
jgi:hypothetical protein